MTVRTILEAKAQAKSLRYALAGEGIAVSHAKALELVAHQNGARDWNTLHARLRDVAVQPFHLKQRVRGLYLGKQFRGEIIALASSGTYYSVSIRFDEPVDTVTFDSFSNMRRLVRSVIDGNGRSIRKTSDGKPQLALEEL